MIKNEKQYKISKNRLANMEQQIAAKKDKTASGSKEEDAVISLTMLSNSIKEEMKQYETLK